jgi:hypothetical protein
LEGTLNLRSVSGTSIMDRIGKIYLQKDALTSSASS